MFTLNDQNNVALIELSSTLTCNKWNDKMPIIMFIESNATGNFESIVLSVSDVKLLIEYLRNELNDFVKEGD